MDADQLSEAAHAGGVFARVAPARKLRLVKALQKRGKIVAMTGNGGESMTILNQCAAGAGFADSFSARKAQRREEQRMAAHNALKAKNRNLFS